MVAYAAQSQPAKPTQGSTASMPTLAVIVADDTATIKQTTKTSNNGNIKYDTRTKIITKMDTNCIRTFCIKGTYGKFIIMLFTAIGFGDSGP